MSTDPTLDAALAWVRPTRRIRFASWCRDFFLKAVLPRSRAFPAAALPEFPRGIPPLVNPADIP
jgi:hypothetical protein